MTIIFVVLFLCITIAVVAWQTYVHDIYFKQIKLRLSLKNIDLDIQSKEKNTTHQNE